MILTSILIFFVSLLTTFLMRQYALIDIPNERSSHDTPTPRGGGVGIVTGFTIALIILYWQDILNHHLIFALCGGIPIAILGFCDDVFRLNTHIRFLTHLFAALWAVYWLNGFPILDLGTWQLSLNYLGTVIAIIAIIWMINLYNFMDGIDGLAGSEGIFACVASATILLFFGLSELAQVMLFLAAAIAGFIVLNWPPAKIFLGDVGSCFLGYIFAVFGIATARMEILPVSFWLIIMAVFICDATYTVIWRGFHGKAWWEAHREHAYQVLNIYGLTHKKITIGICLLNFLILFPAAWLSLQYPKEAFFILNVILLGFFILWYTIKRLAKRGSL